MLLSNILRATVATAAIALATGASAASVIYGGGATATEPYYNSIFAIVNGTSPAATFGAYDGIGAGAGRTQFETNYPNSASGWPAGSTVHYGASDAYLSATEITNWSTSWTTSASSQPASTVIPAQQPLAGNLIQIPMEGDSVGLSYNETANPVNGVSATLPALILTDNDICGIYSGLITDWSGVAQVKAYIKAHATKFASPAFPNFTVTYRSDSSGVTFLFTQHLAKVCNSSNSNFSTSFTGPVNTWSASLFTGAALPSSFVAESGSAGVAGYLDGGNATTAGSGPANTVGYLSPDYTSLAPKSANTTWLPVAAVTNAVSGKTYKPTVANIQLALSNPGTGATNGTPPSTEATAAVPSNWVPSLPTPADGYAIVGYSNWILPTCYQDENVAKTVLATLKNQYNKKYAAELTNDGLSPVQGAYATAILSTFIANTYAYKPNLAIQAAAVCKGAGGKGTIVGR